MREIVGKQVRIDPERVEQVMDRLRDAGVSFDVSGTLGSDLIYLRYEDSPKADHLVAEFILPPEAFSSE